METHMVLVKHALILLTHTFTSSPITPTMSLTNTKLLKGPIQEEEYGAESIYCKNMIDKVDQCVDEIFCFI